MSDEKILNGIDDEGNIEEIDAELFPINKIHDSLEDENGDEEIDDLRPLNPDTFSNRGKDIKIGGRDYRICACTFEDAWIYLERRLIVWSDMKETDKDEKDEFSFKFQRAMYYNFHTGYQYIEKIVCKYLLFKEKPMTEDLLQNHDWSVKDLSDFLEAWVKISD